MLKIKAWHAVILLGAAACAHAASTSVKDRFKEIVAGEGNVGNIEFEELVVSSNIPMMGEERNETPVPVHRTKFYRIARQGEFYSMEGLTGIGGNLLLADGRDGSETWRYRPDQTAESLNARGSNLAKGRLERISHQEQKPSTAGRLLREVNGNGWAYRWLSTAIKMGIPLTPGSGCWTGDSFSGLGLRPDLHYQGQVHFSEEGRPVTADYTFSGPDFEQRVNVRYLEYRAADGLPSRFSVSHIGIKGTADTSEILYTIHSLDLTEAPPARFSAASYGEEKNLVVARYSDDQMVTTYKGRVQGRPETVSPRKPKAWVGATLLMILTPIVLFYAGRRLRRSTRARST